MDTIKYSLTTHRGCYGECNFCAIAIHQGRTVTSRSEDSILKEIKEITKDKKFKGNISDVGGPTANMYQMECTKKLKLGACSDKRCLYPNVCPALKPNHKKQISLLEKVRSIDMDTIKYSLTTHRGCYGECNFCAIAIHQGRTVTSRSEDSILKEIKEITKDKKFKGNISDVGGPTANMYQMECTKKLKLGACSDKRCLYPNVCPALKPNHKKQISLLEKVRSIEKIKKVFIASGIRYDLILGDKTYGDKYLEEIVAHHVSGQMKIAPEHTEDKILDLMGKPIRYDLILGDKTYGDKYLEEIVAHHVSGQMKIAPEHTEDKILDLMGKPGKEELIKFKRKFYELNKKLDKKQFLTYYLIAAHPGCNEKDMLDLKIFASEELKISPEQVQIFTPTPST